MTCTVAVLEFVLAVVLDAVAEVDEVDEFVEEGLVGMPVKVDVASGEEEE